MQCPVDQAVLQRSERQGVEIDHCPKCRGVWLDRGELDKLIERSNAFASEASATQGGLRDHERYADGTQYSKKKRKESFLGDVFDF